MKIPFEDYLSFIEDSLGIQLLSYQKEMLQKLYENKYYYFLPYKDYGKTILLTTAKLLEEMKKEN